MLRADAAQPPLRRAQVQHGKWKPARAPAHFPGTKMGAQSGKRATAEVAAVTAVHRVAAAAGTKLKGETMNAQMRIRVFVLAAVLATTTGVSAQKPAQETFPTAEDAVVAMVDALKADDKPKLLSIFGPEVREVASSGNDAADRNGRGLFLAAYNERAQLLGSSTKKTLLVGSEEWPFPIPLSRGTGGWKFETALGLQELRNRRIGRNELATIRTCREYVEAQKEYAQTGHDGKAAGAFAQKFVSEPGRQDGLYWKVEEGKEPSPLGDLAAQAAAEGYKRVTDKPNPFRGYYFRILTAQGAGAKGGAKDYLVNGEMRGGFAMIAFPAEYGASGVVTFLVSRDGIVFQKDLGANTAKIAGEMKEYNPDKTWVKTE